MKLIFNARMNCSKIEIYDVVRYKELTRSMYSDIKLIISNELSVRSDNMNRYYWKYLIGEVAKRTGNQPIVVHDSCKKMFLIPNKVIYKADGILLDATSRITVEAFTYYINAIIAFFADFDIILPYPNEVLI